MANPGSDVTPVTHVLFDLDGTLLDTESVVDEITKEMLSNYGHEFTQNIKEDGLGRRPLEAVRGLVRILSLPCTAEEYLAQSQPLLESRLHAVRPLPGAVRLLSHLRACGVATGLATSTPRALLERKLAPQDGWKEQFAVVVAGDEVVHGKPAPEIYLEAAKRLGADPKNCLVVEDAPSGVAAGKAAGMRVVAIPSLTGKSFRGAYHHADVVLSSLLDFEPERWGLPPINDRICGALAIEPWRMRGPVVKGFGRGSKVLGIPTANLPASSFGPVLAHAVCGIYLGWARVGDQGVFKMVMSVGWNPCFENTEKSVEPWILHTFEEDFYGEDIALVVVGYIRPEAPFPSLAALRERILEDGRIAEAALAVPPFADYEKDEFLLAE